MQVLDDKGGDSGLIGTLASNCAFYQEQEAHAFESSKSTKEQQLYNMAQKSGDMKAY